MMGAWPACFFVLIVDIAVARDLKVDSNYVIKTTETCPNEGYYFQRDAAPNSLKQGPCYLCFCQNNGTSFCWSRENHRCDVEKYHLHRIGRETRSRRSPVALSDIFFRDATRDFFNKQLPEQCKPHQASFSEGCPPADWCVGCTVCDCDANGRWDCHILSFCDGKERKQKVKSRKPRRSAQTKKRNNTRRANPKSKGRTTLKPKTNNKLFKKIAQNRAQLKPNKQPQNKQLQNKKPQNKQQNKNKKPTKSQNKPQAHKGKPKKTPTRQFKRKLVKKPIKKPQMKNQIKSNGTKGKVLNKPTIKQPKSIHRAKIEKMWNRSNDTLKLGQKIVKQVMSSVQKLLRREMNKINSTIRQHRSANTSTGCGGVNNKESLNVKSNAVARNITINEWHAVKSENQTHTRKKRDILNETQAELENVAVLSLQKENTAVLPLPTVKNQQKLITSPSTESITSTKGTTSQKYYYKYSLHNVSDDVVVDNDTDHFIENLTEYIPLGKVVFVPESENIQAITEDTNQDSFTENIPQNNPEFNDIKFTKWYIIKINQENNRTALKKLLLPKPEKVTPENIQITHKKTKHVTVTPRMVITRRKDSREINITKDFTHKPLIKQEKTKYTKHTIHTTSTEVTKAVSLYKTLIKNYTDGQSFKNKSNATNKRTHVTGIQNILQNLLAEINKNNSVRTYSNPKVNLMKQLRTFFNKIFDRKRNVTRLHKTYGFGSKEDHTLQILCGNFGPCKIKKRNKLILKYKLKRLNEETESILKSIRIIKGLLHLLEIPNNKAHLHSNQSSSFQSEIQKFSSVLKGTYNIEKNNSLTETQLFQINYIKMNTQAFMDSIRQFANTLKEILPIIKPKNNTAVVSIIRTVPYEKIRLLLSKYSLIQNSLMRRLFQLINGFEKATSTENTITQVSGDDVTLYNHMNDILIEKNSKNIIENLRRLRILAQSLSSKRRKRQATVIRDDGLDYLLTLMEYLLKRQNSPLDLSPANDGVDFLIDAIKNAPDIKPIRKKALQFTPMSPATVAPSAEELSKENNSELDLNQVFSKEKNNTVENASSISKDDKDEPIDSTENDVTATVYYRKFNVLTEPYAETTNKNIISFGSTEKRQNEEREKIGFDKFESSIDAYADDETTPVYTTALVLIDIPVENITESVKVTTTINKPETTQKSNISSSESQESASDDKKSKLDWIEETFDKEIKEYGFVNVTEPFTSPPIISTTTVEKSLENMKAYIAHADENSKKRSNELKPEDVMHRKQVEFLTSLDYGTEKPDFEDTDSKDDGRSDDSAFPSYFV